MSDTSTCTCVEFLVSLPLVDIRDWNCEAVDHDCVCNLVTEDMSVFGYIIDRCRSNIIHNCVCKNSVIVSNTDNDEAGTFWCRSPLAHSCVCLNIGPDDCRAKRHQDCICSIRGSEECRVEEFSNQPELNIDASVWKTSLNVRFLMDITNVSVEI